MINILITDISNNLSDWLTLLAIIAALVVPFLQYCLLNRIKKSKLTIEKSYICNQDNDENAYYMGRLIIKNGGKFIAKSVEPYIENIEASKEKQFFFPIPLKWTHSELNEKNPSVRDIYPNQSVYLDLFYYIKPYKEAKFIITAGKGLAELEDVAVGVNKVNIIFYQKNGQVDKFSLEVVWSDRNNVPEIKNITKCI